MKKIWGLLVIPFCMHTMQEAIELIDKGKYIKAKECLIASLKEGNIEAAQIIHYLHQAFRKEYAEQFKATDPDDLTLLEYIESDPTEERFSEWLAQQHELAQRKSASAHNRLGIYYFMRDEEKRAEFHFIEAVCLSDPIAAFNTALFYKQKDTPILPLVPFYEEQSEQWQQALDTPTQ